MTITVREETPLKWPSGWERCRIQDRKPQGAWKRTFRQYRDAVAKELQRMGATEMVVYYNPPGTDRMDCGVAVWFSKQMQEDYTWQEALGLFTPAPTLAEIDEAYRRKVMPHHPDRGGDVEIFKSITKHRDRAKAWVLGTERHEHEYVMAIDRFTESRLNLAAVRLAFSALRQLDRVGAPGILERSMSGFKTALPAQGGSSVAVSS